MIAAEDFVSCARNNGFSVWSGVPCSYLKPLINCVISRGSEDARLRYVGAANEGDAVAIASGAHIAGARGVAMFQNSGLGNAVNPLTSLNAIFEIPVLLIITLRGDPQGKADEPQHALMGQLTTQQLELMGIEWSWFPSQAGELAARVSHAAARMDTTRKPYAFVMKHGAVADYALRHAPETRARTAAAPAASSSIAKRMTRNEALQTTQRCVRDDDVIIATTGYTGRELYALGDHANQLYMVGSMGCASSFALGVALVRPNTRVIVLDGDGAALMRLGALATLGYERPHNLFHVLLDNEMHESTGGQSTVSHSVDFAGIAANCGYPRVERCNDAQELETLLRAPQSALTFAHCKIAPGVAEHLPRPSITPIQVAQRFARHLQSR